jgi:hypothetical protein
MQGSPLFGLMNSIIFALFAAVLGREDWNAVEAKSWSTCETIDGDCMACPFLKELSPTATVHLRDAELVQSATDADKVISSLGQVTEFDPVKTGLHTSLFYFCCHNLAEESKMKRALQAMEWQSFDVIYDDIACNLDHNNVTIYLHALPSNQTGLFALATQMEKVIAAAGVYM